jgi:hypothetical protein
MLPHVSRSYRVPSAQRWHAAVQLLLVLVLFGCSRRETKSPIEAVHPPPAQPSGTQIGKTDSLMNATVPGLSEWVVMWRAALPGFAVDSLWAGSRGRWRPISVGEGDGFTEAREGPDDVTFELLVLPSPDGEHLLYVDHYQAIEADGDIIEVGGEPDSEPALIDRRRNTVAILRSCGTVCGFHWGTWLSPTTFALGGWQDADAYSQWKQGTLSIYSIPDSTVTTYLTRVVSAKDYGQYVSAWESWLLKRYRALRSTRP